MNAREERHQRDACAEAGQRGADRKPHRDDRAEREEKDHHRDEQPDAFRAGRWLAFGGLRDLAAELDLDAGVVRRADCALQLGVGVVGKLSAVAVVADGREGDGVIGGSDHRGRGRGRDDVVEAAERGERVVERGGVRGIGQGALGGVEHHLGGRAREGRERRLQEVSRLLGLDAGQRELVFHLPAGDLAACEEANDDEDPGDDDPPAVAGARAAQAIEEPRHGSRLTAHQAFDTNATIFSRPP